MLLIDCSLCCVEWLVGASYIYVFFFSYLGERRDGAFMCVMRVTLFVCYVLALQERWGAVGRLLSNNDVTPPAYIYVRVF